MLSIFCRAENNRFFLERSVELRPGFLAKWIEIVIHDPEETSQAQILQNRMEKIKQNLI